MQQTRKFERWVVVFAHDGAPVDSCLFAGKPQAEKARRKMKSPDRYDVVKMVLEPKK